MRNYSRQLSSPASANALTNRILIPKASFSDTLAAFIGVFLPTLAKGVIIRRPLVMAIAELLDLDRRAVRTMQRIRAEYGPGPVMLRIPGRRIALILDPQDVHRVLAESPDPFATATPEKTAVLAHFEPKVVLLSSGTQRADRRRYNEQVLEPHRPVHEMRASFEEVVRSETGKLLSAVRRQRTPLTWRDFSTAWFRIVRRVILGDAASEDNELSSMMATLRYAANWAFLRPQRRELRARLLARLRSYLVRAEPNSLAGLMAHIPASEQTAPEQQITQWLFAFDAAGMTTFRSLALLATHPEEAQAARREISAAETAGRPPLTFLRAAVLDTVRLWPTSPLILREATQTTEWRTGVIPANTGLVIFTPFFHRDDQRLPYANSFVPELWTGERRQDQTAAFIPFSEGPASCPGRELVLLLSTAMLAQILSNANIQLQNATRLAPDKPKPLTLNHFRLRFQIG